MSGIKFVISVYNFSVTDRFLNVVQRTGVGTDYEVGLTKKPGKWGIPERILPTEDVGKKKNGRYVCKNMVGTFVIKW